jgi:hypothetical protein
MRRNRAEREDRPVGIASANKEKQDLLPADIECAEAVIGLHHRVPEKIGVELPRPLQIRHVEARLEDRARQEGRLNRVL